MVRRKRSPGYSPDGHALAFLRGGDVWVISLNAQGLPQVRATTITAAPISPGAVGAASSPRTPPSTIRVRHDAANSLSQRPCGTNRHNRFRNVRRSRRPSRSLFQLGARRVKDASRSRRRSFAWFWILQHDRLGLRCHRQHRLSVHVRYARRFHRQCNASHARAISRLSRQSGLCRVRRREWRPHSYQHVEQSLLAWRR